MIPGLDLFNGGFTGSSSASAGANGGNTGGITFGEQPNPDRPWLLLVAVVAVIGVVIAVVK